MADPGCSNDLQLHRPAAGSQRELTLRDAKDEVCCNGDHNRWNDENEQITEKEGTTVMKSVQGRNLAGDDSDTHNLSHVPHASVVAPGKASILTQELTLNGNSS